MRKYRAEKRRSDFCMCIIFFKIVFNIAVAPKDIWQVAAAAILSFYYKEILSNYSQIWPASTVIGGQCKPIFSQQRSLSGYAKIMHHFNAKYYIVLGLFVNYSKINGETAVYIINSKLWHKEN